MVQQRLPVVRAIELATGKRIHVAMAIRWCTKGRRGRRLRSWPARQGRVTTVLAVREFLSDGAKGET
jgi:hypothetical protein